MFLNDQWSVLVGTRFDQVEQKFENQLTHKQHQQTLHQASPRLGVNFKASIIGHFIVTMVAHLP
jgi:iron complex outermembrane receptor protein